jgi:(p)ppGpp synthase/HD superfamily hydrolase
VSHLLAVSSLVLEAGGDEEQATAALLHDALEDQGGRTSFAEIDRRFGTRVATIVRACSDTEVVPKPPWRERKQDYLVRLEEEHEDALLVSLADKLHNARTTLADVRADGACVWARFNVGEDGQRWYYTSLVEVFTRRLPDNRLVTDFQRTVDELFPRGAGPSFRLVHLGEGRPHRWRVR